MTKTAQQKAKYLILNVASRWETDTDIDFAKITGEEIDDAYADNVARDQHWDAMEEVRGGEAETEIKCEWSRHYESKSVAAKLPDGSWIGWTYWYGGGKHGQPEVIDWIDDAYDLTVTEEEKTVVVRSFSKAGDLA